MTKRPSWLATEPDVGSVALRLQQLALPSRVVRTTLLGLLLLLLWALACQRYHQVPKFVAGEARQLRHRKDSCQGAPIMRV